MGKSIPGRGTACAKATVPKVSGLLGNSKLFLVGTEVGRGGGGVGGRAKKECMGRGKLRLDGKALGVEL